MDPELIKELETSRIYRFLVQIHHNSPVVTYLTWFREDPVRSDLYEDSTTMIERCAKLAAFKRKYVDH